jgi:hypothetical protein
MKYTQIFLNTLFLFLGFNGLQAQEVITTSGGNISGNEGSVSYSIGQVVYATNTGPGGSVAQGVQQPFEISVLTGFKETSNITLRFNAFPNPTAGILNLTVDATLLPDIQKLSYELFDTHGNLLKNEKLTSSQTLIDMGNLVSAIYFLKISGDSSELTNFKIIKY